MRVRGLLRDASHLFGLSRCRVRDTYLGGRGHLGGRRHPRRRVARRHAPVEGVLGPMSNCNVDSDRRTLRMSTTKEQTCLDDSHNSLPSSEPQER